MGEHDSGLNYMSSSGVTQNPENLILQSRKLCILSFLSNLSCSYPLIIIDNNKTL